MDNVNKPITEEELLLSSINMANLAINMPEEFKINILQKYDMLAEVVNGASSNIVESNIYNYSILLNKTLFIAILNSKKPMELARFNNLNDLINKEIANNNNERSIKVYKNLYNKMFAVISNLGGTVEVCSPSDVQKAIETFGIEEISDDELSDIDNIDIVDDEDIDDIDMEDIFDDDEDTSENTEDIVEDLEETEDKSDDLNKKEIGSIYGAQINQVTSTLVDILTALYKSGFDAMPQEGIYINNGEGKTPFIKLGKSNEIKSKTDEAAILDYKIMGTICSMYPQYNALYALGSSKNNTIEAVPTLYSMMNDNAICHMMHLQFQSANIDYCTGRNSIHRWITETQLKDSGCNNVDEWIHKYNNGKRRLTSFKKYVQPWYRWCIKNLLVDSLDEAGIKSLGDADKANSIIEAINRALRNVVVVQERNINKEKATAEKIDLKLSASTALNCDDIINTLESKLNIAGSNSIKIKQLAKDNFDKYGVLTISIEFDEKAANASDLFAYEIVDKLIESGNTPSWGHALLGKKEDGSYLFWDDFMGSPEPFKRIYTIYAGSRSGKGVMTSTLIASLMCDGKLPFYTDGKPENGACLGEIAWREGKEAYVFDGQAIGKRPFSGYMENYTNGVRQPDEIASYIEQCPKELFVEYKAFTTEKQKQFLGVMRYLKSLQLCATIATKRASGDLPSDDWQVWVFDEMTDMSNNEKSIRALFASYVRSKTGAKEVSDDDANYYKIDPSKIKKEFIDKSSDKYDAGLDYILQWLRWTSGIKTLVSNMSTISMGKANMNLIFIFQEATWIQEDQKITTIGKVVKGLKSTKIVGRNALANACRDYGDASTQKEEWYTKVNSGGGWWGISESADLRSSKVTVFKPYKVWTTPLIPGTDDRDPNGDFSSPKYLAGYISKLLGSVGVSAADILNQAYVYADEAVKTLGYADSVKEYIYDCTNFAVDGSDNSYDVLHNELESEEDSDGTVSNFSYDDEDSEDDELDFGDETTEDSDISDDDAAFSGMGADNNNVEKIPEFTSALSLSKKELKDETLVAYLNKYRVVDRLKRNSFRYNVRANVPNGNGLLTASLFASNYVYVTNKIGIGQADVISFAFNQINADNNTDYRYSFLIGMINALNEGSLEFDRMPTEEQLREWQNAYIKLNNTAEVANEDFDWNSVEISFDGNDTSFRSVESTPEEDIGVVNASYSVTPDGTIILNNMRPEQQMNAYRMTPENSAVADYGNMGFLERRKKALFESKYGMAYSYKKRWETLLRSIIHKFPSASTINEFGIRDGIILAKRLEVDPRNFEDEQLGVSIYDMIEFHTLFKMLPMIEKLVLDQTATQRLVNVYGSSAQGIWQMFQEAKFLKLLRINTGNGWQDYRRNDFASTVESLDRELGETRLKSEIQYKCDTMNPRKSEMTKGYIYGVRQNAKEMRAHSFGVAREAFMSPKPKLVKSVVYSGVGLALAGVGLIAGITGGIGQLFSRRY